MHLHFRHLCLLLITIVCLSPSVTAGEKKRAPNVILVMTDDQGYGDLGCHGNKIIQTPNLDKLHTQSIRLTNFHVDPTCSPTRSALMTGRYSDRVGVWHTIMGRSMLRGEETTIAELMKAAGYVTGIFGKWHLGDNYPMRPQDQGFDEVFINGGGGVGQTPDYFGNNYFDDTYFHNGEPEKVKGYCTDVWFDAAMKFMKENKDRPFFAYIPTNAPHGPYFVAEKYKAMYQGKKGVPNAAFWGMITNIDENMGRLESFLEEEGLRENTILIFMTDNGTAAGFNGRDGFNAGMRGRKGSQYDGGHRVPFFIRWPAGRLGGGRDIPHLTAHLDVLPTVAELCGVKTPASLKLDGMSLVPLLRDIELESWPERTLIVESQRIENPQKWRKSAVMTDRWRLIDGKELYDMTNDPGQKTDVAKKHPEVVKQLTKAYETWWADVSKTHEQYARIGLGSAEESPARLTGHDWHEGNPPWHQSHIVNGAMANGYWAVDVTEPGVYEFELRRWPVTAPGPIGKGLKITPNKAQIKIMDVDLTKLLDPKVNAVTFRVPLKAGPGRLQTWFKDGRGRSLGAYYVYVRKVEKK